MTFIRKAYLAQAYVHTDELFYMLCDLTWWTNYAKGECYYEINSCFLTTCMKWMPIRLRRVNHLS